jgi:hypothetical protein
MPKALNKTAANSYMNKLVGSHFRSTSVARYLDIYFRCASIALPGHTRKSSAYACVSGKCFQKQNLIIRRLQFGFEDRKSGVIKQMLSALTPCVCVCVCIYTLHQSMFAAMVKV